LNTKDEQLNILFTEKYRPTKIEDCILPQEIKTQFINIIKDNNLTNLLLAGSAGTGKTTIAKILCKELDCEYLTFNGSDGSLNIEMLRDYINDFVSTVSLDGSKLKVVFIDEADGLSTLIQQSLRNFMELFTNVRFILTCNYPDKIINALQSRCSYISFKFKQKNEIAKLFGSRLIKILKQEQIQYDVNALTGLLKTYYPDQRRILNEVQRYSRLNNSIDMNVLDSTDSLGELFSCINNKDFSAVKDWLTNNIVDSLFNSLFNNMESYIQRENLPAFVICLGDAAAVHGSVPNQELNILSALTKYMESV